MKRVLAWMLAVGWVAAPASAGHHETEAPSDRAGKQTEGPEEAGFKVFRPDPPEAPPLPEALERPAGARNPEAIPPVPKPGSPAAHPVRKKTTPKKVPAKTVPATMKKATTKKATTDEAPDGWKWKMGSMDGKSN